MIFIRGNKIRQRFPKKETQGHKYNAKRVEFGGRSFPSQLQANTFGLLRLQESAGEISNIRHEVTIRLEPFDIDARVDFLVFDERLGEDVAIEAKGFPTSDWKLKVKVWEIVGPYRYRIYVQGSGKTGYPVMRREVVPARFTSLDICESCNQPRLGITHDSPTE